MNKIVFCIGHHVLVLSRAAVLLGRKLSGNDNWNGACLAGDHLMGGDRLDADCWGHVCEIPRHDKILFDVMADLGDDATQFGRPATKEIYSHRYFIDHCDASMMEYVVAEDEINWRIII